jgi:hypothetical protein
MKSFLPLIAGLLLLLSGCSHKPTTIVGTWRYYATDDERTFAFDSTGRYSYTEQTVYQGYHSHQLQSGTYYVQNGTLTLNTSQERLGLDQADMAVIAARERRMNPHLHIPNTSDVPVVIAQPMIIYLYSITDDNEHLRLKDTSNAADNGHTYRREPASS